LVTVIGGVLPMALALPVQLSVPVADTVAGLQLVPGIDTLSPGVPFVQLTCTVWFAVAGSGVTVQFGITVCGTLTLSGIVPVEALSDFGSVTVIGGLLPRLPALPVQVRLPVAGTVAGLQFVVPGIDTTSPGVAFVQVSVTVAVDGVGFGLAVQLGSGGAAGAEPTCSGTVPVLDRPEFGSVAVSGGSLPRLPALPVQVRLPEGGTVAGLQLLPGIDICVPDCAFVQLTVTVAVDRAGFGLAVQLGSRGFADAPVPTCSGIVPVLVWPVVGSVTVIVGLLPKLGAGPRHATFPSAGTVAGAQVAPGIATVVPGWPFVQVIVTVCAAAGFGLAVQLGSAGPPTGFTCNGTTPLVDRSVVGSVTVIGGLLPMALELPVQVRLPEAGIVAGVQLVSGTDTLSPGVPPVQASVTC
jgi:hypothetical protein